MTQITSFLLAFILFTLSTSLVQPRPMTVMDLHAAGRISSFDVSTSADMMVYSVRYWDHSTGQTTSTIKLQTNIHGDQTPSDIKTIAKKDGFSDSNPVLSPTGDVVAFLSNRASPTNVHVVSKSGTESSLKALSNYPVPVSNLMWKNNSNGDFLLFTAEVYENCTTDALQCTADIDKAVAERGSDSDIVFEQLYVRHWDVYVTPNKVSHLFMQELTVDGEDVELKGDAIDLMAGMKLNCPVPPFGGSEGISVNSDGSLVAFTAETVAHDTAWTTGWRVYTADLLNPTSTPQHISNFTQTRCQNPSFSNTDPTHLAFLIATITGSESAKNNIALYNTTTRTHSIQINSWDRSPSTIAWSKNDEYLIVDADNDGYHNLFLLPLTDFQPILFEPTGTSSSVIVDNTVGGDDSTVEMFYLRNSYTSPNQVIKGTYHVWQNGSTSNDFVTLTKENQGLLTELELKAPDHLKFSSFDGQEVQLWLFRPFDSNASDTTKKYPIAFLIHGGPQGAWNDGWSYRWNPQLWASRGYAVVAVNPRGSTGFGQNFTDAVNNDWGGGPYQDLMVGLDWVINNQQWTDGNALCACGASYGGYMINWIHGQTNRFNCLVVHDGVFDTLGMAYETDELFFTEDNFGGTPWDNPEGYEEWNPRRFVKNWTTPMLVVHGGHDYRVPLSQGISVFNTLQRLGIESKFLFYPEESHWVLNPVNGITWYNNVLDWLDHYTGNVPPYQPLPPITVPPTEAPSFNPPSSPSKSDGDYPLYAWVIPTVIAGVLIVIVIALIITRRRRVGYDKVQ